MFVFLGYLTSIIFIVALYFLSKVIKSKNISRKILHVGIIGVFFIGYFFWDSLMHFAILSGVSFISTLVLSRTKIFNSLNREEGDSKGIVIFCFSFFVDSILCFFINELRPFFPYPIFALCLGDGFAALIGCLIKSPVIYKNKTIVGTISCLVFTFLGFLILKYMGYGLTDFKYIILLAILVSIAELVVHGIDNITVPFTALVGAFLLANYGEFFYISLIVAEAIFILAFFLKATDYYGSLGLGIIAFLFYFYGGLSSVIYLVSCYVVLIIIAIIRKIMKKDFSSIIKKTKSKDIIEIFVNGFFPSLFIVIYGVTNNIMFMVISLCSVSANFVDSLASDIGTLSNKRPYDFIKKQYVPSGLSGGITFLGTFSSFIGSIIFSLVVLLITGEAMYLIPILSIIMMIGCILDSILGSVAQVKYKCDNCGIITENTIHCGVETSYYSGVKFINNDAVNMICSFAVSAISLLLLLF